MSINVTVTGNPISIQKGRMVTASPNHSKKEFDRRRLIRISQVRQQSKNIAEDVRNRVKQQKLKQIEDIEKEGQKKLKQWQAKKLLELQNQCHEALKDMGAVHKEASLLADEEILLMDRKENEDRVARRRAEVASKKLHEEKNRIKRNVSVPILKKKLVRQMENKRAHMISGLRRSSESLKKNVNDKLSTDTEVSGRVSDSEYEDIDDSILKERSADINLEVDNNSKNLKNNIPPTLIQDELKSNENNPYSVENSELSDHDDQLLKELREQKDTRISDRIKRRSSNQLIQPDICETLSNRRSDGNIHKCASEKDVTNSQSKSMFSSIQQNIYACSCSRQSPAVPSPTCCDPVRRAPSARRPITNINSIKCFDTTDEEESTRKDKEIQKVNLKRSNTKPVFVPSAVPEKQAPVREIPTRPKVTLKSVKTPVKSTGISSNTTLRSQSTASRFLSTHVERITEDSLIISPEPQNNNDFLEKIRQRDRDAIIRGQRALQREKLQREYNDLMKKLPALQKLERLYEMNEDKPEYHMTEERLREQEKKKQSVMDDTYEKLFPDMRPSTVTIPIKNASRAAVIERDNTSINQDSLNLGTWEDGRKTKKLYTEEEVEALLRDGKIPPESKFRTDQLKMVLEKLRKQKEEILKEIQTEKFSEALPFTSSTKVQSKNDGSSSDSSSGRSKKEESKATKKKMVSVKVGTDSLQNSSPSDISQKTIKKQLKATKETKTSISKEVQVASISKKSKSPKVKKFSKDNTQNINKQQKSTRDILSSSEQSLSDKQTQTSIKSKTATFKSPNERTKNVVKEQKSRKETSSSSDQSVSDVQVTQTSVKTKSATLKSSEERRKNSANKQKNIPEIPSTSQAVVSDSKMSSVKEIVDPSNTVKSDKNEKREEKSKIVILSNTVIPSVPANSLASFNEPINVKTAKNHMVSCDCEKVGKKAGELCEIVIKIKDGKSSEVLIKDKSNSGNDKVKSVVVENPRIVQKAVEKPPVVQKAVEKPPVVQKAVEKPPVVKKPERVKESSTNKRYDEIRDALNDDCCRSKDASKPESWHDKFSKNNSQVSTSSTSYMSPPHLPNKPDKVPPYFCDLIGRKQLNLSEISAASKLNNQNLLGEVQKLLAMSRQSIDELGVSSVSTVTTPSQSIVDLDSNKANSTPYSSRSTRIDLINEFSQSRTTPPNFSFLTVSSDNRTILASEMDSNEQYPDILTKYAKIADQCSQRISDLTSMIEKVREDKNRMLQSSSLLTTNDSSTKYMDLPSPNKSSNSKGSTGEQKSVSSSSSSSGDSKLLDINFSLAEKLKGLTPEQVRNFGKEPVRSSDSVKLSKAEEDLAKRLKALKDPPIIISDDDKHKPDNEVQIIKSPVHKDKSTKETVTPSKSEDAIDFIPLLLDIPKVPALAADSSSTKHKKPPPSKSLLAARKYTDFIAPHELSTIPEQDSQMRFESTLRDKSPIEERRSKVVVTTPTPQKSTTPQKSPIPQKSPTPQKSPILDNKVKLKSPAETNKPSKSDAVPANAKTDNKIPTRKLPFIPTTIRNTSSPINNKSENIFNRKTSSPITERLKNSSITKENKNYSDNSLGSSNTSGDEKVEMLRIEAMLRSIGMEWAISTLRKTQEALALTSSSSSLDIKSPSTLKHLNESDIKEYLSKQLIQKISSSTLRTDASPGSLNESREFSDINHSDFLYKQTSTPVNRSRERENPEKSSDLPSAIESDKMANDFFSLPERSPT